MIYQLNNVYRKDHAVTVNKDIQKRLPCLMTNN